MKQITISSSLSNYGSAALGSLTVLVNILHPCTTTSLVAANLNSMTYYLNNQELTQSFNQLPDTIST
jgi:hypothetical protein